MAINRLLCALRRRMMAQTFLTQTTRATLFFFGLLVALRSVVWWGGQSRPDPASLPYMLSWPLILGAIAGALITFLRRPSLRHVAAVADSAGHTNDRLLSSLVFSEKSTPTPLEQLTIEETRHWLGERNLLLLARLRFPSQAKWLVVPLATLALLWWHEMQHASAHDARVQQARSQTAEITRALDAFARHFANNAVAEKEDTWRQVAERAKQGAGSIRAEADRAGDAERVALRALIDLEELVQQLQQPHDLTPVELKALAQALEKNPEMHSAAQDIRENRLSEAVRKLDAAGDAAKSEIAKNLQDAITHLEKQKEQLSARLEALKERAAGNASPSEVLEVVSQLLREIAQNQKSQTAKQAAGTESAQDDKNRSNEGGGAVDQELRRLLGALQALKNQQQNPATEGTPGEPEGDSDQDPVVMFGFSPKSADEPSGHVEMPTGQPGSDGDEGPVSNALGNKAEESPSTQRTEDLQGLLGEGESLSAILPSAGGGDEKAVRRYKELTEAASGQAEDAVLQENIPLGARFLIKRYFEAIRAKP